MIRNFKVAVENPHAVIPAVIDPLDNFKPPLCCILSYSLNIIRIGQAAATKSKTVRARLQHEIRYKLNVAYYGRIYINWDGIFFVIYYDFLKENLTASFMLLDGSEVRCGGPSMSQLKEWKMGVERPSI